MHEMFKIFKKVYEVSERELNNTDPNRDALDFIAVLLEDKAERLSVNCCNDFELDQMIPDIDERTKFVKEYHVWNGDPDEFDPKFLELPDFAIARFMADRLRK